jgi:diaminopimelate epimerase
MLSTHLEDGVSLVTPRDFRPDVPLADGRSVPYVWTGTHHVVLFVDDAEAVDPAREAPPIRHDPGFAPEGTNVNFVEVKGPQQLAVRTFEKGVEGETLACGTGALAAALVAHLAGRSIADLFTVRAHGGTLVVGFSASNGSITDVFLEGPAERVFTGILEIDPRDLA